jgi:hypothetical protein
MSTESLGPPEQVALDRITIDRAFQVREGLNEGWVGSLAEVMEETPQAVPPVALYAIADPPYAGALVLVNGFHGVSAGRY